MTSPFLSELCRQIYYLSMMHTWKLMDRSPKNCALVSNRIRDYNSKDGTQFCAIYTASLCCLGANDYITLQLSIILLLRVKALLTT